MMTQPAATLLLLETESALGQDISDALRAFEFEVICISSIEEAAATLKERPLDAVILDLDATQPTDALEQFASLRPFTLPFIILMSQADVGLQLRAIRAGCSAIISKPIDFQNLSERLQGLVQPAEPEPYRVLVVEDSRAQAMYLQNLLERSGIITQVVLQPLKALEVLTDFQPDLVLLDHYMPDCNGPELAALIRLNPAFLSIPIVFLSTEMDAFKQLQAMKHGADDYLTKSIQPEHLISSVQIRAERTRLLRGLMLKDSLTGLLNHSTLKRRLQEELARSKRYGTALTFAMIDVDHFKVVNDTYGHSVGDQVLLSLSSLLQKRLRRSDIIGRYGGEEFGVLLPQTGLAGAQILLDRLREVWASIPHQSSKGPFHVTFSCGLAEWTEDWSEEQLHGAADEALYRAKRSGRNKVEISPA